MKKPKVVQGKEKKTSGPLTYTPAPSQPPSRGTTRPPMKRPRK